MVQRRIPGIDADLKGKPFRILEVGCGDCVLLLELKTKYPLADCHGLDFRFTDKQREICSARGINLIASSIEEVVLEENCFDLVIMNQLIEHTWHPIEILKKIRHTLKDNGKITISTINFDGYDRWLFHEHYWGGYYIPRHLYLFNRKTLQATLEKSGFVVCKRKSLVAPIVWIFSFHSCLTSSRIRVLRFIGKFMTDRNPLLLAIFTLIDIMALTVGLTTSNQQMIAKKVKSGLHSTNLP